MELRSRTVTDVVKGGNPRRFWGLCVSFPRFEEQKDQHDPRKTLSNQNLRDISLNGIPIAYQHGSKKPIKHSKVGKVTHTFNGEDGDLRNLFYVDTDDLPGTYVKKAIELNHANEVSLGFEHSLSLEGDQFRVSKEPLELSIVEKGKQDHTKVLWFCSEKRLFDTLGKQPDTHPGFFENITDLESAIRHNTGGVALNSQSSTLAPNMASESAPPATTETATLLAQGAAAPLSIDFTQASNEELQGVVSELLKAQTRKNEDMEKMKTEMDVYYKEKKDAEQKDRDDYLKNFKQNQETLMEFVGQNPEAEQTRQAMTQFTKHVTDNMSNEQVSNLNMALSGIACNATDVLLENKTLKEEVEKLRKVQVQEKARLNNQLAQQWNTAHANPLSRFQNLSAPPPVTEEFVPETAPETEEAPAPVAGEKRAAESQEVGVETNAMPPTKRQRMVHSQPISLLSMVSPRNRDTMQSILAGNRAPLRLQQAMYKVPDQ